MLRINRESARWLVAEVLVVVIGILLAIAINTWWEERKISVEGQEILHGLHSEFVANQKILTRNLAANQRASQLINNFLALPEDSDSANSSGNSSTN